MKRTDHRLSFGIMKLTVIRLFAVILLISVRAHADDEIRPKRLFVETGAEVGTNVGDESRFFSYALWTMEVGYLRGARSGQSDRGWGLGCTLYTCLGEKDWRFAVKPRLRYRFHPRWAVDLSAGLILSGFGDDPGRIEEGFVGGVGLNYHSWLTLKTELMAKPFQAKEAYDPHWGKVSVVEPAGTEVAIYGGVALRGKPGWIATGVGSVAILIGTIVVASAIAAGLSTLN
jgi:hypothetical protein